MQKNFLVLSLWLCGFAFNSCTARPALPDSGRLKPLPEHAAVAQTLTQAVEIYHYKKPAINDSLSRLIFDRYFKDMDPNKMYFLESDLQEFRPYRDRLDDFLKSGDMSVPFAIYNRYLERQSNRFNYVLTMLKAIPKPGAHDEFTFNREKAQWLQGSAAWDNYWKKRVEYDLLSLHAIQKDSSKNIATLKKRYESLKQQLLKVKSEDVFKQFMDAFASTIDPHTAYFSPQGKEDFNIEMAKSLQGIGALLGLDNNQYIKIVQLTKGGPAEKSKKLFPNDRIVAVAQGRTGEFVDIIGWRQDEAVSIIRGAKGSIVRLKILPANSAPSTLPHVVELVRDKINLNDRASSSVKEVVRNDRKYRIGVITLNDFYMDFEAASHGNKNYNSTSRDVRRILDSLKKVNVDGVVLDLRSNGGGSLKEAIDLTGLFIKQGPVVQVKDYNGKIEVDNDKDPEEVYNGPFAVLINNFSASASEIFAGAIQDYGRGVIIGENSYGKGTVQTAFNINEMLPSLKTKLGQFNLTVFKFYRINGSSTQRKGVAPDILFPSKFPSDKFGEQSEPSALPWDQIRSSSFSQMGNVPELKDKLVQAHNQRMQGNRFYQEWLDDVADFKQSMSRTSVQLNLDTLKNEQEADQKKEFKKYNILRELSGLSPIADTLGKNPSPSLRASVGRRAVAVQSVPSGRVPIDPELLIKLEGYQVIADMVDLGRSRNNLSGTKSDFAP